MKIKSSIKRYLILHLIFLLYAVFSLLIKKAGSYPFLSVDFVITYMVAIICMLLYAITWQQLIKYLSLTVAYANRAVVILWGMFFGIFFYNEKITVRRFFSRCLIIIGIILFATSDNMTEEPI